MSIMNRHRRGRLRRALRSGVSLFAAGTLLASTAEPVLALPQGGQVAAGDAQIASNAAEMAIHQNSQNAVINWQSFNIAAGERVSVLQPNAQAALLNRVLGSNPSEIFGQLQANGRVFLVNPAGVYFAPGAQVDAGAIIASTMNITNADFMAGRYNFVGTEHDGKVINKASLAAQNGGLIALLGKDVVNEGVVVAKKGTAVLAAGEAVTLDFGGDGKVEVVPTKAALEQAVTNKGLVEADGGLVFMSAATGEMLTRSAVNQDGVVRASSLADAPGAIRITARDVNLGTGSLTDASGMQGGTIEIGGGWQGTGTLAHAQNVNIEHGAALRADATADGGAGGTVAVWSDGETRFAGEITARGKGEGAGGAIETSGHHLTVEGTASASSERGKAGKWLLDPANVFIEADSVTANAGVSGGTNTYTADETKIHASQIATVLNGGTDVEIVTGAPNSGPEGNITVNADVVKTAGNDAKLTLRATQNIRIRADIKSTAGKLSLDFISDTDAHGGGNIEVGAVNIATNGGDLLFHGLTKPDGVTGPGYASSDNTGAGIEINGTNVSTAGGNVTLYGTTSKDTRSGIELKNATVDAGGGTIDLHSRHNTADKEELLIDTGSTLKAGTINLATDRATLTGTFMGTPATGAKATLNVASRTASRDISIGGTGANALVLPATFLDGTRVTGFHEIAIGAAGGTGTVSVDGVVNASGNLKLQSGKVLINQDVTIAPGSALTIAAGTEAKATGKITADEVTLDAADAAVTMQAANAIGTVTGKAGSLALKNTGDITLGKAGNPTAATPVPAEGLTIKAGATTVESSSGDIKVAGDGVTATGAGSLALTTSTGKSVTLEQDAKIQGTGTNALDLKVKTGTLDLASGTKIDATGGAIDLAVDHVTLPGTETDLIKSAGGEIKIDTATVGHAIGIGAAAPASGDLSLDRLDFIAAGAKKISIGSKDTGAVTIGNATASSSLAVESGTGITLEGGTAGTSNADLSLRAPSIDFAGAQSISAGSGNLTLEADSITNWSNATPTGTGAVTVKRRIQGSAYTIGGTGTYLDNAALAKLKAGGFDNVIIGDKTDAGKLTIDGISDLPSYTTLFAKGGVHFAGPIAAGEGAGKTLVVYSENGMTEGTTNPLAVDNLLLWGKGDFKLDTVRNGIRHLATDLHDEGSLALNNRGDLQTASITNKNNGATVAGVEAKAVKLDVEGPGTLDAAEKIKAHEKAGLKSDAMTIAPGKIETKDLKLGTETDTKDIAIGDPTATPGAWNLAGSKFDNLKIGDANYNGNVTVAGSKFAGNTDIETKKRVTLSGNNMVGEPDGDAATKDLTITADSAQLPLASDELKVNKLTLNLKGGLDLGLGSVKGKSDLQLGGMGASQNIFISNTYDPLTDPISGGYKVAYNTVNHVLSGFNAVNLEGPNSVYFDAGSLTSTIKIKAAQDIIVRGDVNVSGQASKVDFVTGHDFKLNAGTKLNIEGATAATNFNVEAGNDITFGQGATATLKTAASAPGNATINANLKAEHGKVTFDQNAMLKIDTDKAGRVDVTTKELQVEQGAEIDTGSAGTFALNADVLTDHTGGTGASIKGAGTLAIQPLTSGQAMHIGNPASAPAGALTITSDQLNGHLFGQDFIKMYLGAHSTGVGKAGVVTVDGLNLQKAPGKKAVDVSLGAGQEVKVGAGGMTIGDGARLNVFTQKLSNAPVGGAPRGKITVGDMSSLHVYVNDIDDLQASAGSPAVVGTGGILGLRTLDAGKTLALGNGVTGDMKITNEFMKNVVGTGFSEYDFGQGGKDGGTTQSTINIGDFDIGADRSKHTYITADNINIKGKFVQHGTDSVILRTRGTAKEEAGGSIEAQNLRLEFKGNYDLSSEHNKIGTVAANNVGDVSITSDKLTIGTVTQPEKLDNTTVSIVQTPLHGLTSRGNIKITTDELTLDQQIKSSVTSTAPGDQKDLTIQQKSAGRDLYLGTPNAAGLSIDASSFNGAKIAGGFNHVTLGRADGTGKAHVTGNLVFKDATTINGLGGVDFVGGQVTGQRNGVTVYTDPSDPTGTRRTKSLSAVTINAKKLSMDNTSDLTAGAGDLTLAVDTLDIAGAANADARIHGTGNLVVKTYTKSRDLYLQSGSTTNPESVAGLNLFSEYFEDGTTNKRVFRDGFSLITIGATDATGELKQEGTVGFTDPVNIVQALDSSQGGVTINGSIDTHGNDYSVKSRKVKFSKVHIINYKGGPGPGPSSGPYTYITTDEFIVDDESSITSNGVVNFSTYTPGKEIHFATPGASGSGGGLVLDPKIFSGEGLLKNPIGPDGKPLRYQNIIIGDATSGNIDPSGLTVAKGLTDAVTLKSGGSVGGTGAITGVDKLNIEAGSVNLTNENNKIGSIGTAKTTNGFTLTTAGGVTLDGPIEAGGPVNITNKTSGNVTIGEQGKISTTNNSPVYITAENGNLKNKSTDSNPISTPGSNFAISTKDSVGNDEGTLSLHIDFHRYGTPSGTTSVAGYTGSGFFYVVQPTVHIYSERPYGDSNDVFFKPNNTTYKFETLRVNNESAADKATRDAHDAAALNALETRIRANASGTTAWNALDGNTHANAAACAQGWASSAVR